MSKNHHYIRIRTNTSTPHRDSACKVVAVSCSGVIGSKPGARRYSGVRASARFHQPANTLDRAAGSRRCAAPSLLQKATSEALSSTNPPQIFDTNTIMDQAAKAQKSLEAGQYAAAVTEFTEAIARSSTAVAYYIGRSTAYQRSSPPNLDAALKDAEIAVNLATKRAKRELIAEAQQRRAVTLFALGQYANAGYVFGLVKKYNDKEKTLPMWEMKVQTKLKTLPEDDDARKVTAVEVPDAEPESTTPAAASTPSKSEQKAPAKPAAPQPTPADKVKQDWYSSGDNVCITILAKGVPKEKVVVEFEERSVSPTTRIAAYA